MVFFDVPFAFVTAGFLGWRAHGKRRDLAITYTTAGVAVPALIFLERFPDWDWQYFFDPAILPAGLSGLFLLSIVAAGWLGHRICSESPKRLLVAAGLLALYFLWSLPRTLYVGDFAQFNAGQAPFLPAEFLLLCLPTFSFSGVLLFACWRGAEKVRSGGERRLSP